MNLRLADRVVLVTGGASGIGAAVCAALLAEGAMPVCIDRHLSTLAGVHSIRAELTSPDECRRAAADALASAGRIDGLVNNAGVNDGVGLGATADDFSASIRRNLSHYFDLMSACTPHLVANGGAVVNVVSKVAFTGQGGTSGYAAANGGRAALTREWAAELAPKGVRVNGVVVAECWTPMYERWLATRPDPAGDRARIEARIPLGERMTTADEIAAAVVFLLSPASSHTTGQLLHVDGGYVHLDRALG